VLSQAGLLSKWGGKPSKKGTGFAQPLAAHQHWHIDVSYLNISGTFYYLCSILDGFSRCLVNWGIRETMTETDIEIILQGAKERYPQARPQIISDNGPQFIAEGLQGVHSNLGNDARPHLAVLPTIEREDRALAQIAQRGVHSAWNTVIAQ
jgi:transposase InsO family protein